MLEKILSNWLVNKKYECFYDYPIGGKFHDLIAIKDKELIAFEFKKYAKEIPTAMGQCLFYLQNSNRVYIVIPKKEKDFLSNSLIETLKNHGIGLMVVDDTIKILIKAKKFSRDNISFLEEIRRKKKATINGKTKKNNVRERITEVLEEHPEGLTTIDISKYIGMSRHSLAKYIYQLLGEGKIFQREIGTAKLCYLKGRKHERK